MNLYLISGLGADNRIFEKIQFSEKYKINHIEWVTLLPKETLREYAQRLSQTINKNEPYCLIGVSFGGMVAIEMLNYANPIKTILISSASSSMQLPWYYKLNVFNWLIGYLPPPLLKRDNAAIRWAFGVSTKEEKQLFKSILADSDASFMKWAMKQIVKWNGKGGEKVIQIHGTADKIIPFSSAEIDYKIKGGGHFMVYNKANEISEILESLLLI